MDFHIVVAADQENGIGKAGTIPWHIPAEMRYFAALTKKTSDPNKENAVIMGRTTWESLPQKFRPLPERFNIVLTRNADYELPEGVAHTSSLEEALKTAEQGRNILAQSSQPSSIEHIFVIGGGAVFKEAINHPNLKSIHFTQIKNQFGCDTFFPEIDPEKFTRHELSPEIPESGYTLQYLEFTRKN